MRLAATTLIAAFLLIAPAAQAKEIKEVRACGTEGCVTTRDNAVLQGLMNGGPPTVPPATEGAAYRLTGVITEPGQGVVARVHSWWVPSLRMLVGEDGTWMPLDPDTVHGLQRVTSDLTPIPGAKTGLSVSAPAQPKPAPAAPADDGGGVPGWLVILVPVAVVAVAAAVVLARRRPRGDFPVPAP
jgi:hypothetical protein